MNSSRALEQKLQEWKESRAQKKLNDSKNTKTNFTTGKNNVTKPVNKMSALNKSTKSTRDTESTKENLGSQFNNFEISKKQQLKNASNHLMVENTTKMTTTAQITPIKKTPLKQHSDNFTESPNITDIRVKMGLSGLQDRISLLKEFEMNSSELNPEPTKKNIPCLLTMNQSNLQHTNSLFSEPANSTFIQRVQPKGLALSPLQFQLKKTIIQVVKENAIVAVHRLSPIDIELWGFHDVLDSMERGDVSLTRHLFFLITCVLVPTNTLPSKTTRYFSLHEFETCQKPLWDNVRVWLTWAYWEETMGKIHHAMQVYETSVQYLTSVEDKIQMKSAFDSFRDRVRGQQEVYNCRDSEHLHNDEESGSFNSTQNQHQMDINHCLTENQQIKEIPSTPISTKNQQFDEITCSDSISTKNQEIDEIPCTPGPRYIECEEDESSLDPPVMTFRDPPCLIDTTPSPPKMHLPREITSPVPYTVKQEIEEDDDWVTGLSQLNIQESHSLVKEKASLFGGAATKEQKKAVVTGSRVTLLTPVRASKSERIAFGVDKVVTPVRRCVRHHTFTEQSMSDLLEAHGHAFVPNKAIFKDDI